MHTAAVVAAAAVVWLASVAAVVAAAVDASAPAGAGQVMGLERSLHYSTQLAFLWFSRERHHARAHRLSPS